MPEQPWWYLKRRKNPSGVLGRPRSPLPLIERRKLARRKYQARLATRGVQLVRLLLPVTTAARLERLARERGVSPAELACELIGSDGSAV